MGKLIITLIISVVTLLADSYTVSIEQNSVGNFKVKDASNSSSSIKSLKIINVDESAFPKISLSYTGVPKHSKNDVNVKVDGSSVPIESFDFKSGSGEITNIILVMDVSGSMSSLRSLAPENERLGYAQRSALKFLENLPKDSNGKLTNTRIGIVVFSSSSKMVVDLTDDYQTLRKAIENLSAGGGTEMYEGAYTALERLNGIAGNKAIILFSDGISWTSMKEQVIELAKKLHIPIYTIALSRYADASQLKFLAEQTGGSFYSDDGKSAADKSIMTDVFEKIVKNVQNATKVTFAITPKGEGVTRFIEVEVQLPQEKYYGSTTITEPVKKIVKIPSAQYTKDQMPQPEGQPYSVTVVVESDFSKIKPDGIKIIVKKANEPTWQNALKITMQPVVGTRAIESKHFTATIPSDMMQAPGIAYYIQVEDVTGHKVTAPRANPLGNPYMVAVLPNKKPIIALDSVSNVNQGEDIIISGNVADDTNFVSSIVLYYKNSNQNTYDAQRIDDINSSSYQFSFTIPNNYVHSNIIEYYLVAEDNFGLKSFIGTYDNPYQIKINIKSTSCQPTSNTYTLYIGWNLLGTSFDIGVDSLVNQVEQQANNQIKVESIWVYDTPTSSWKVWRASGNIQSQQLTIIEKNRGFWMHVIARSPLPALSTP